MDRNSRPNFAAFAAEEERQRASEVAARERRPTADDIATAQVEGNSQPERSNKILSAIRRVFGR